MCSVPREELSKVSHHAPCPAEGGTVFATLSTHAGTCNLSTTQGKEGAVGRQREGWGRGLTALVAPTLHASRCPHGFGTLPSYLGTVTSAHYRSALVKGVQRVRESEHCSQKSNTCLPCGP